MTQLIFKNGIEQSKMNVLLGLIKSWDIEAEMFPPTTYTEIKEPVSTDAVDPFSEIRGMWADRDIDDKELRRRAWGNRFVK
jgi:hypothetical protein